MKCLETSMTQKNFWLGSWESHTSCAWCAKAIQDKFQSSDSTCWAQFKWKIGRTCCCWGALFLCWNFCKHGRILGKIFFSIAVNNSPKARARKHMMSCLNFGITAPYNRPGSVCSPFFQLKWGKINQGQGFKVKMQTSCKHKLISFWCSAKPALYDTRHFRLIGIGNGKFHKWLNYF